MWVAEQFVGHGPSVRKLPARGTERDRVGKGLEEHPSSGEVYLPPGSLVWGTVSPGAGLCSPPRHRTQAPRRESYRSANRPRPRARGGSCACLVTWLPVCLPGRQLRLQCCVFVCPGRGPVWRGPSAHTGGWLAGWMDRGMDGWQMEKWGVGGRQVDGAQMNG